MPPSEIRTNLRSSDVAIDFASDVLPTPGGPTKQRIGPFTSGFSLRTARYSRMRSFAFTRSEWSASRMSFVRLRSMTSSVRLAHGSATSQSRYVRDTVYSAAATGIFDSRSSSRSASFFTASGMPAASIFALQLLDLLRLVVALAQLLLDRLELLAQEVVALVLADLRLHLRLDLRPELEDLELLDQDPVQQVHARAHVERLEHLLLDRRSRWS